jgi:hypothetical protein
MSHKQDQNELLAQLRDILQAQIEHEDALNSAMAMSEVEIAQFMRDEGVDIERAYALFQRAAS